MHNAKNKTTLDRVAVYPDTLEIRMRVVDLNVLLIRIVRRAKLVYNTNVKILVLELVV